MVSSLSRVLTTWSMMALMLVLWQRTILTGNGCGNENSPIKSLAFCLWLVLHNRIMSNSLRAHRNMYEETTDHVIRSCPKARYITDVVVHSLPQQPECKPVRVRQKWKGMKPDVFLQNRIRSKKVFWCRESSKLALIRRSSHGMVG